MSRPRRIALTLLILLGFGAAALWHLSTLGPRWYAPPDPSDQTVVALADAVEYRLVEEAQKLRPAQDNRWTLRVRESQVNAWLAARLPKWIAHRHGQQWPSNLGTPQVRMEPVGVSVAVPVVEGAGRQVLVARLVPQLAGGQMNVWIESVALGRIKLRGESMADLVQFLADHIPQLVENANVRPVIAALEQGDSFTPEFDLSDGRRVRLLNFRLADGWIDFEVVTLPPIE